MTSSSLKLSIFELVKKIPDGKVIYFGQIAKLVGTTPRVVGYVMSGMNKEEMNEIPWYRVVAKNGFISSLKLGGKGMLQKQILLDQGYGIVDDCVDMQKHLWSPDS